MIDDKRPDPESSELTDEERATYEWQMWVPDFGEVGQQRLKNASVLVTRCGGLGSVVAYELAAAGIGKLVLAHAGQVKHSDLNRQLLMTHAGLGKSRVESARRRLLELNPRLQIETVAENVTEQNVQSLVSQADVVVDCAPLFEERLLLNQEVVAQRKPMVDCAMYELEAHLTTIIPGRSPCLKCLYPQPPQVWRREFPVFGAVSGMVGCLGAMEAIKIIARFGDILAGKLVTCNLRDMTFRTMTIQRDIHCSLCADIHP
ncbi:MAG: HesA/MoeB/ThiF family protein [Planctomycetes bacterium]|nr:HesA/MoeB/ThiF family protein [Planctomycetota bacterium]